MRDRRPTVDEDASGDTTEALRAQLQNATEWIRHLLGLLVQACGFFIAADALLVGYGITQKKAVFLFFGCLSVAGIGMTAWITNRAMMPANFVALLVLLLAQIAFFVLGLALWDYPFL